MRISKYQSPNSEKSWRLRLTFITDRQSWVTRNVVSRNVPKIFGNTAESTRKPKRHFQYILDNFPLPVASRHFEVEKAT